MFLVLCLVGASTTCMGIYDEADVSKIKDPSAKEVDPVCVNGLNAPCNYAISSSTDTYYEFCFSLEDGAGGMGPGSHSISNGGTIDANGDGICSN